MFKLKETPLPSFEYQYAQSLMNCLENGVRCENRTGIDTFAISHQYFHIQNVTENLPILKGKKIYPKKSLIELFWMFNGETNVEWLEKRGVTYWKAWADESGSIGRSYGWQFRDFSGSDPLLNLLEDMINSPSSRRLIVSLWNHPDLDKTTLPPCLPFFQFTSFPSKLGKNIFEVDLHVTQRSADSFIGVPYDALLVSYFLILICHLSTKLCNSKNIFIPKDIHYTLNDYHIYENHQQQVNEYLSNVTENKNNVIDQRSKLMIDCVEFYSEELNSEKYFKLKLCKWLQEMDKQNYSSIKIVKNFQDEYDSITASVAK